MQGLPDIGDVLDDTYKIEGMIGKGGFGAVYKARQLSMDREVAIKILVAHAMKVDEMIERFRREVMAVRNLGHPNTIRIYDFRDRADGMLYYAMEYVKGPTLKDVIKEDGPMSPRRCVHILRQTLKSLAEAHSFSIVHRDLKPANIMLAEIPGETDFVKVLDFGIAKIVDGDDDDEREQLTNAGVLVGTLNYMSPEQIAGGGIGPGSDLYALALIGIEMLTGQSVFAGTGRWEVLHKQISDEPVEMPAQVEQSELGPVFEMALKKRPKERYQSAQEMLKALDDLGAVSDQPVFSLEDIPTDAIRNVDVQSDPGSQPSEPSQPSQPSQPAFEEEATQMVEPSPTPKPTVQQPNRQPVHSPVSQQQFSPGGGVASDMPTQATELPQQLQQQQQPGRPVMHSPVPSQPQHAAASRDNTGMHAVGSTDDSTNKVMVAVAAIAVVAVLILGGVLAFMLSSDDGTADATPDPAAVTESEEPTGSDQDPTEIAGGEAQQEELPAEDDAPEAKEVRLLTPGVTAQVFQDGELLGETPLRFPVSEKTTFALKADGYEETTVELTTESDEVVDVEMTKVEIAVKDSAPTKKTEPTKTEPTKTEPSKTTPTKTTPKKKTSKKGDKKADDGWVDVPVKKEKKKPEVPVF